VGKTSRRHIQLQRLGLGNPRATLLNMRWAAAAATGRDEAVSE